MALASDLTTVVQLGDLVTARLLPPNDIAQIKFVELKVGRVNKLLYEFFQSGDPEARGRIVEDLRQECGGTLKPHALRMRKQLKRLAEFNRLLSTGEGLHPVSGKPIRYRKHSR